MLKRNFGAMACVCLLALTAVSKAGDPGVAAIVDGKKITTAELDARALKTNMKLAQSLYEARKKVLDDVIMEKLLEAEAKTKGVTAGELLKERIAAKSAPVTDADIKKFYDDNSAKVRGRTLERMSSQIKQYLIRQGKSEARKAVLAELTKDSAVKITLDPPRADVIIAANDPTKGPKDAKITIVEYSDFQ